MHKRALLHVYHHPPVYHYPPILLLITQMLENATTAITKWSMWIGLVQRFTLGFPLCLACGFLGVRQLRFALGVFAGSVLTLILQVCVRCDGDGVRGCIIELCMCLNVLHPTFASHHPHPHPPHPHHHPHHHHHSWVVHISSRTDQPCVYQQ